jgi:hypothetical protein
MKHIKLFEDFSGFEGAGFRGEDKFPHLAKYNPENSPLKLKCWWVTMIGPIISTWNDLKSKGYRYIEPYQHESGHIALGLVDPEGNDVFEMNVDLDTNKNYDYVVIIIENDGVLIPISKNDVSPSTLEMLSISEKNPDDELLDALTNDGIISEDSANGSEICIFPYEINEVYDLN